MKFSQDDINNIGITEKSLWFKKNRQLKIIKMENRFTTKLREIFQKESISESDVSYSMSLIRKTIEDLSENDKEKFVILNFFCDWCLHAKIDKSIPGMEILQRMNEILVNEKNYGDVNGEMKKTISFEVLRNELKGILQFIKLPTDVVTNDGKWGNFLLNLIEIILDCPLKFPAELKKIKKIKNIYDKNANNPLKKGMWVVEIKITKIHPCIYLEILTSDTTRIVTPIYKKYFTEPHLQVA